MSPDTIFNFLESSVSVKEHRTVLNDYYVRLQALAFLNAKGLKA